jgi:hypothetical protein
LQIQSDKERSQNQEGKTKLIAGMENDENKKVKDLHERKLTDQKKNNLVVVIIYYIS